MNASIEFDSISTTCDELWYFVLQESKKKFVNLEISKEFYLRCSQPKQL